MDAADILLEAANRTAGLAESDEFFKLTEYALKLCGSEIARYLSPADKGVLFTPVNVLLDGKELLGAALVLHDRMVLGWTKGTLRIKNFEAVVPLASIRTVEELSSSGSTFSKSHAVVRIAADQVWELHFAPIFDDRPQIPAMFVGALEGWLTVSDSDTGEQA